MMPLAAVHSHVQESLLWHPQKPASQQHSVPSQESPPEAITSYVSQENLYAATDKSVTCLIVSEAVIHRLDRTLGCRQQQQADLFQN